MTLSIRAVFLDRDGVISRSLVIDGKPVAPFRAEEFEILPGVAEALDALKAAGFRLVVVTNQPEVARGRTARSEVEAMHATMRATLPVDEIRVCYHDGPDRCSCRKPAPGMLVDAAHDAGIDLSRSFMVGDRWRDIEAGRRAGCSTVFVDHGYDEALQSEPDLRAKSLPEAAEKILTIERAGRIAG